MSRWWLAVSAAAPRRWIPGAKRARAAAVPETGEGKRARLGLLRRVAASAALGLQGLTVADLKDFPALSACDAQTGRPS